MLLRLEALFAQTRALHRHEERSSPGLIERFGGAGRITGFGVLLIALSPSVSAGEAEAKAGCQARADFYMAIYEPAGYSYFCQSQYPRIPCYYLYARIPSGQVLQVSGQNICWVVSPPPPACPVAPLQPITDLIAKEHEEGKYARNPDMDHVTSQVQTGASCILQKSAGLNASARVTSGFRPPAYQAHLREVWDKWQLLKNNSTEVCRLIKAEVQAHWVKHAIVRQPVKISNHSSGNAVDIGGVPPDQADQIASQCNMFRPEPAGDPVHFQPR